MYCGKSAERRKIAEMFPHVSAFPHQFLQIVRTIPVKVVKKTLIFQLLHFQADESLRDGIVVIVTIVFLIIVAVIA